MAKAKKTKKVAKKSAPAKKSAAAKKKAVPAKKQASKPPAKKAAKAKTPKKVSAQKVGKKAKGLPSKAASRAGAVSHLVSPLDDRVLVRLVAGERTTPGGLILPETSAVTGNLKGDVVAVGRGHVDAKGRLHPLELRIGDRVVFAQFAGSKVAVLGEELVILRESEILGVLET